MSMKRPEKGIDIMGDSKKRQKPLGTADQRSNLLTFVKATQPGPCEEALPADYSTALPITDCGIEPLPPEDWPRIYLQLTLQDEFCSGREATAELRPLVEQVETANDFCLLTQHMLGYLVDNRDVWMNTCIHSLLDASAMSLST